MKLKGKVAVVTGGNSGIGFGIAEAFASEGAVGAIVGRTQETLDSSVAQLGERFVGIRADVTKQDDLERVFNETTKKFGKIDIVVANAGGAATGAQLGSVAVIGESDYDKTMDLNLKSVYFTVHRALPYMKDGGSIILIGSNAGHRAYPSLSLYGAAKAAVIAFARGFSLDLLDRRIRVNVLSPGTVETPVFGKFIPREEVERVKKWWVDGIPVGRIGQPSDIGKTAVFLASDDSAFMLGSEILTDGGVTNMTPAK
ncbi:SDR family NAD(P)-dependent oxidoreductase [Parachryseolinea silvisoli]|jgi:NAD(P)-dependent dehydrogenase (short-subunit alcohol dehydrogenase family)|uniref:SDR family NAD(P)-dependent oxidoreductase n=1 Tax=Parachryseolinea silvisoli TaxID=2873601 RepID=UPI002265ADB2|nr:glucose 1-dehydrogenase [Parachryseolinea silvisoli]MCD9019205.1 glucose 1-dehydrogenase [Parachryseolinea silvisoli]